MLQAGSCHQPVWWRGTRRPGRAREPGRRRCGAARIELPVAAAVEAVALFASGGDRDGSDAGVAGEAGLVLEPVDSGGLSQQLGGRQRTAALHRQQLRGRAAHELGDLPLKAAAVAGQLSQTSDEVAGDPQAGVGLHAREATRGSVKPTQAIQRAGRDLIVRDEVVQVPAQAVLNPGALGDEILAMIEQQLGLKRWAVQTRTGQVLHALTNGSLSHGGGVNLV